MAITSHKLVKTSASLDSDGNAVYKNTYLVESTDVDEHPGDIGNAPGITLGTGFPGDPTAFCDGLDVQCVSEDGLTWEVQVSYGPSKNSGDDNPLNEPGELSVDFQAWEQLVDRDANNTAIRNSAKDAIPGVVRDQCRPIISYTYNTSSFNIGGAWQQADSVNANTWQGIPPGKAKMMPPKAQRIFNQKYGFYWKVTLQVAVDAKGWEFKVLDQGTRKLVNGKKVHIEKQGVPVSEPELLDGNGDVLDEAANPHWLTFELYPKLPF